MHPVYLSQKNSDTGSGTSHYGPTICRCVLFSKAHSRDVEEARCCRPSAGSSRCWSSLLHSRLQHAIFKVDFVLSRNLKFAQPVKVTLCNKIVHETTYLCCCALSLISRHLNCLDQVADLEDKAR